MLQLTDIRRGALTLGLPWEESPDGEVTIGRLSVVVRDGHCEIRAASGQTVRVNTYPLLLGALWDCWESERSADFKKSTQAVS